MDAMDAKWELRLFFDGACPLCRREIEVIQRFPRSSRVEFTDIAAPSFRARDHGLSFGDLMSEIHAQLPDGRFVTGVEAFRRLYSTIGFSWVVWITRVPPISSLLEMAYRLFARNRLRWTGRCTEGLCERE